MKSLKLLTKLAFAFSFIFISSDIYAQGQTPEARSAEAMANQLTRNEVEVLKLDAKEAKDLKQINLMYAERMMELRKTSATQNKTEVEALKRSHSQKIKSLLSSEKYQAYLALKEDEKKKEKKDE